MTRIEILSASAGSGKTYALTHKLEEALRSGEVRPTGILATTFTVKAAAELGQRARSTLLAEGRPQDAQRLAASRIGTVHSVCGRLLADFAFEAGLPPELRVLGEAQTRHLLRRAIDEVLRPDELETLQEILSRFWYDFEVHEQVGELMELARANDIPPDVLGECGRRSGVECLELLGERAADGDTLDRALLRATERFVDEVDLETDTTQRTRDALDRVEKVHYLLRQGRKVRWSEWVALAKLEVSRRHQGNTALAAAVSEAALAHDVHPRLHDDLGTLVPLLFDLAGRALASYESLKKERGLVDFVDQETKTLELLKDPVVRDRLREQLDLVLVDEFQDTSPVQLALFLELSALADRSVWVGDQKQAIFGFRGTDPALMEAAMDHLLEGEEPETLDRSWRSVPGLVEVTTDLFVRAFEPLGIPPSRVRLAPAEEHRPDLSPCFEHWVVGGRTNDEKHSRLAACVEDLLADPEALVEDPATKTLRPVEPRDVAILCRRNATTLALAEVLRARGIDSALHRAGLFETLEGRVALAGLELWIDSRDSLAAATLSRLLDRPDEPEAWLREALEHPRAASFLETDRVRCLLALRELRPGAGPGLAVESVFEALDLPALCRRWGDATQRLANLEALLGHANAYAGEAGTRGEAATVTGLRAHFAELADAKLDDQAVPASGDAVTLSTWHGAKGLEWPVTVLFELDWERDPSGFGVRVVGAEAGFDPRAPLADRGLAHRPNPFHPANTGMRLHDRLRATPAFEEQMRTHRREQLRLLYVGWTRARDRLVLACARGDFRRGTLGHLRDASDKPLLSPPANGTAAWAGREVPVTTRDPEPVVSPSRAPEAGTAYVTTGPRDHPPAWLLPSSAEAVGAVVEEEPLGDRLALRGRFDERHLGEVLHGFFAADDVAMSPDEREGFARRLIGRWGLSETLDPTTLVEASDRLHVWIERRWPGARTRRELPLLHRLPNGTVVRGTADLVLETPDGLVLLDHKAFPGTRALAAERAAAFAGQLDTYRGALEAAEGHPVTEAWIHLPVVGLAARVSSPHRP